MYECSDRFLVDRSPPQLTLDDPELLDTYPGLAYNDVHVMLPTRTFKAFIYIRIHAEGAEEVCGLFLVVVPRRHAPSVPLMPDIRPQAGR